MRAMMMGYRGTKSPEREQLLQSAPERKWLIFIALLRRTKFLLCTCNGTFFSSVPDFSLEQIKQWWQCELMRSSVSYQGGWRQQQDPLQNQLCGVPLSGLCHQPAGRHDLQLSAGVLDGEGPEEDTVCGRPQEICGEKRADQGSCGLRVCCA